MINRLPKSFWLPAANGAGAHESPLEKAEEVPKRVIAAAARCIGTYPVAALGAAFMAGLVVGRVVKQ
jgi:hypothetical protein